MRTIRFTPTEADTLDAQRAFYWKRMISRRHLMGYAVLWAIVTGVVAGALFAVAPPATPALFAVALMVGLLLVALIPWLTFASLPRVVKRTYAQQVMLRVEYTVTWSEAGIEVTTPQTAARHAWTDFISWAEGPRTLMLFQSDAAFNFVPKSACTDADLDDIRASLAAAGVRSAP